MTLIRFAPVDTFEEVRNEMENLIKHFREEDKNRSGNGSGNMIWKPRVDVRESDDELLFALEMPGVHKDDFHISFENGYLKIEGERKAEDGKDGVQYLRRERRYGKFGRRFKINTKIDTNNIEARYENGVLMVRLPKAPEEKPRKIEVKING